MSEPLVCAGCALLCDDVTGDEASFEPACPLGAAWLDQHSDADAADATVGGERVGVDAALAHAAQLLRGGRRPLVHGFAGASVEDARAAVALADRIGAIVITAGPGGAWPGASAFPLRGASTATLGEIRDRSGLVVIWREDPDTTHPRLLHRLGFGAAGSRMTGERTLAVLDDRDTRTARHADLRLDWPRDRDAEALGAVHLLARGAKQLDVDGGLRERLDPLLRRLDAVAHATVVYGPALAAGSGGQRRALALHELVRELSHDRHVVTLSLAGAPGVRGADEVLAWQTGYSGPVDLGCGHPEPLIGTAPTLEHERVDVALCVEGDTETTGDAAVIALSPRCRVPAPEVWIRTAAVGVEAGGTMHRLDGVPLALRPPRPSSAPSAAELLQRLLQTVSG
jgi:formylmethanofuran dehydrogenase subunit B